MKNRKRSLWLCPLRGTAIFFSFLVMRTITGLRIYSLEFDSPSGMNMPAFMPYLFVVIANLFILNSIFTLFCTYDREAFWDFKERGEEDVKFFPELFKILRSYGFITETLSVSLLAAVSVRLGAFVEGVRCYVGASELPRGAMLIAFGTVFAEIFLASLFSRYEARRYFAGLIAERSEEKLGERARIIIRAVLIVLLYPLVFPYAPLVIFMFVTAFAVLATVAHALTIIGFILVIALLVALHVFLSGRGHGKRRKKFIKALAKVAEREGRSLVIKSPDEARSLGYDLTYTDGNTVYDIKILKATRKGLPLYFTARNNAHFLHRIGTKKHHLSFEDRFDYSFGSEGVKIIVIIKFPKRVYVSSDGGSRRIIGGDKIWDYIIYDTVSFLGSADRGCLARFNNSNE